MVPSFHQPHTGVLTHSQQLFLSSVLVPCCIYGIIGYTCSLRDRTIGPTKYQLSVCTYRRCFLAFCRYITGNMALLQGGSSFLFVGPIRIWDERNGICRLCYQRERIVNTGQEIMDAILLRLTYNTSWECEHHGVKKCLGTQNDGQDIRAWFYLHATRLAMETSIIASIAMLSPRIFRQLRA